MRQELLERRREVYRLTEQDIVNSLQLADRLTASHVHKTEQDLRPLRDDPNQAAVEIISDVAYYANLDIGYIWAFTLWRVQAVFEGIIAQSFLPPGRKTASGFREKLKAVKAAGFPLSQDDEGELLNWSKVRNRLSHRPEFFYHVTPITREDVEEYARLILRILDDWKGGGQFLPYAPALVEA